MFFVELSQLDEKFAPQGAENILDAVNKSTEWNGRLEMHIRSYSHFWTASVPYSQMNSSMIMKHHWHPSFTAWETIPKGVPTSHIFSQIKKTQTIYTNKKAYSSYAQLEQNLEKIFKEKAYAVVYPELSECVTNIPGADLQVWNHTIDQSFDTKDFVFAVSVDTNFLWQIPWLMRQKTMRHIQSLCFRCWQERSSEVFSG